MNTLSLALEEYTAANSKFETARPYISLSNIVADPAELINQFFNGFDDSHMNRLKCYKGYQMEKDLLHRIFTCFPVAAQPAKEISAFDGLFKGHPDFEYEQYPADCKSVPLDKYMPEAGKVSRKIYWQLNAYMLYGKKDKALVVYESRESGIIRDWWIRANTAIQKEIDAKCRMIQQNIMDQQKRSVCY